MRPTIEQVLERHADDLMRIEGVIGVGQALCEGEPCIRVYLATDSVRQDVPAKLDGYIVSTVVTGVVRPRRD